MQLNELKITSDADLEAWKATWDGVSQPPDVVLNYIASIVLPRVADIAEQLVKSHNAN